MSETTNCILRLRPRLLHCGLKIWDWYCWNQFQILRPALRPPWSQSQSRDQSLAHLCCKTSHWRHQETWKAIFGFVNICVLSLGLTIARTCKELYWSKLCLKNQKRQFLWLPIISFHFWGDPLFKWKLKCLLGEGHYQRGQGPCSCISGYVSADLSNCRNAV